jgi:hypothetical protein
MHNNPYHLALHPNQGETSLNEKDAILVHFMLEEGHLAQLESSLRAAISPKDLDFFLNFPKRLQPYIDRTTIPGYKKWLQYLASKSHCCLILVTVNGALQESILSFDNISDWAAWKEWPHGGEAIQLHRGLLNAKKIPAALLELYQLGHSYFYGYFGSGTIVPANKLIPIYDYEWPGDAYYLMPIEETFWGHFLNHPEVKVEELIPFFESSLCYLMYDADFNVYCGGVEEGSLWRTDLPMEEVLSRLFAEFAKKEGIGSIDLSKLLEKKTEL